MKILELYATKSLEHDNMNKCCLLDSDKDNTKFQLPTVFQSLDTD